MCPVRARRRSGRRRWILPAAKIASSISTTTPTASLALDANGDPVPTFFIGPGANPQQPTVNPIDLTALTPGQLHGVTFTIDLPGRTIKEANRDNNYGGFFYYKLDVTTGAVPAGPANPFLPLDPSVLNPNPECDDAPALKITQSIVTGGHALADDVSLGFGESATIVTLTVTNMSGEAQNDVMACSTITNLCYPVGTLAVGGSKTVPVPYIAPTDGRYIEGLPTTYSTTTGIIYAGAATRVTVSCESYVVVPLDADPKFNPNPDVSTVMLGGKATATTGSWTAARARRS